MACRPPLRRGVPLLSVAQHGAVHNDWASPLIAVRGFKIRLTSMENRYPNRQLKNECRLQSLVGQYWGGGPPGSVLGCCWLLSHLKGDCHNSCSRSRCRCCQRPHSAESTRSHSNSEVKQLEARSVLGWGTAWEVLRVLLAFFCRSAVEIVEVNEQNRTKTVGSLVILSRQEVPARYSSVLSRHCAH